MGLELGAQKRHSTPEGEKYLYSHSIQAFDCLPRILRFMI
jgi:hypothetical protein